MLKITAHDDDESATFKLEGMLAGKWVAEMFGCWQQSASSCKLISIDLTGVTWVNDEGRELLALMHNSGAKLIASGLMMKSIVEEISNARFADGKS